MSTTEDIIHRTILEAQCSEPDISEGACGGVEGLRPITPFSDGGDNLSMEVRFSEGSSRHASDISDVSYQNLLEDKDIPGPNLSRRESEDSLDSYLPDYCDDLTRDHDMMDLSSQQTSSYSDKISDRISIRMTDDHIHILTDDSKVDQKKTSHSVKSDPGAAPYTSGYSLDMKGLNKAFLQDNGKEPPISVQDNFRKHELVVLREQQRSRSLPPNEDTKEDVSKKRNSLEIRNNIPIYGEVKNYEKDIENFTYNNQGAKPKIRKQSPGLACRIEDNKDDAQIPNTKSEKGNVSSSGNIPNVDLVKGNNEKELDHATKVINELIQVSKANALALTVKNETKQNEKPVITNGMMNPVQMLDPDAFPLQKPADIENEYEYVKYSRIQEGNSYVGMRLAYSSSEGGEEGTVNGDQCSINIESPREGTPEQVSHMNSVNTSYRSGNLNDDALTEIPLNGPGENSTVMDEYKIFTLSPENTECDSVEIESVTSDGDDKSPSGMPNVEDGLSSSQTSDVEDNNNTEQNTPTKKLHLRQQQEIERRLYGIECDKMKPKEMDAEAIIDDLKLKREALDSAIADIKTAIQKSKGIALEPPYNEDADNADPIWIKRDEEKVIPRGQSTHEVIHSREEFERRRNIELASHEHDKVYHSENEKDRLLESQQSEGRVNQTPKGYDSDDEYEEIDNVRYTRRIKGKKYSQLPKDDSVVHHPEPSQYMDVDVNLSHVRIVDSVSMYSDTNSFAYAQDSHSDRRNSESQYSSEDFCSDNEGPSKTAYVHQRKDGDFDTDEETDQLLGKQYQGNQYVDIPELTQPPVNRSAQAEKRQSKAKEVHINDPENPSVLIEGVLFRARYLGSTQLISEGQPSKAMRMMQAQEAVGRIKALLLTALETQ